MDEATRAKAIEKLKKTSNMIGYPDVWRNYDALTIRRDAYGANAIAAGAFELRRQLAQIGKPVDRGEWHMTPPTVNAYNNGELNQMVFPAGILQSPFFDKHASIAMNYGAIGMVIGHELTHSFDDEGRKFDGDGNLRDWWTPSVATEFDRRASCIVKDYDGFEALPAEPAHDGKPAIEAVHLKGALTLGENIADLGGIKIAFAAMHLAKERAGAGWKTIGPYTDDQQFFLSFAQGWCGKLRPEEARRRAVVDHHSSSKFRVDGPLANLSEFADAFQCKPGSKMVRKADDRCQVW
jgi:endothelin-converting enzyme/putative endopeptidase